MARKSFAGAASATTLAAAINSSVATISVANAAGYPSSSDPFVIVIARGTSAEEKVLIASVSGTTFTVASSGRGYDSTTAQSHSVGETVEHCIDSLTVDEANAHVNDDTRDDHSQYLNNTRHDTTTRHSFGGAFGTPGAPPAVTTAASAGSASTPARSDHTHNIGSGAINSAAQFGAGVVVIGGALAAPAAPAAVSTAAATGSATAAARADHVHGLGSGVAGSGLVVFGGALGVVVDGTTIQVNGSNQLQAVAGAATVADGSITTAKLAANAVTGIKLAAAIPRGSLGKTQRTTDLTGISTEATVITAPSVTPETAARKLRIYVQCPRIVASTAGIAQTWTLRIKRSTTAIAIFKGTGGTQAGILVRAQDDSPGVGPFVYSATLELTGGAGTLTFEGDATGSSYIEVVDEGGS